MSLKKSISDAQVALDAKASLSAPQGTTAHRAEIEAQRVMVIELMRRVDALAVAITKISQMPAPNVVNEIAAPVVIVAAAKVDVPATVVNVEAGASPDVQVDVAAPVVNVSAPNVNVQPPQVHVSPANVTVESPQVAVSSPVTVTPSVMFAAPRKWVLTHHYSVDSTRPHTTVAEAVYDDET